MSSTTSHKRQGTSPSSDDQMPAKKKPSVQKLKSVGLYLGHRANHMKQFNHTLNSVRNKPSVFAKPEFKVLREFCEYRDRHKHLFPPLMGDVLPLVPNNGGVPIVNLTPGYIDAIASYGDTSFVSNPILQVVEADTAMHKPPFGKTVFGKPQQSVKITHLRLLDGDNNTMMGRLAINITDEGKKLKTGEIIRLDLLTELNHAVKEDSAPPKPVVYVSKFSVIGFKQLPRAEEIKDPLESTEAAVQVEEKSNTKSQLGEIEVPLYNTELCSLYGIRMIVCVCKANPIDKINLQTLKEECKSWFADEEVADMSQSHKRCMLYWWFATNIYGICGSHNRAPLPDCLVAAVRKQYPEPDGKYTGFKKWE